MYPVQGIGEARYRVLRRECEYTISLRTSSFFLPNLVSMLALTV